MTSNDPEVQPTGWLFTRGNASVRMTVEDAPAGVLLVVRGPGTASASYDFQDTSSLMEFAGLQEQQLRREGFQLQAIAERRSAGARREVPPPGFTERRRR